MNRVIQEIEEIGKMSGMRLNRGKCEAMLFGGNSNVHFPDQTKLKTVDKSKYLGCILNKTNNTTIEVRGRIREAMGILKRMHQFWRHSNCNLRFKLTVIQAVLFSKILFGLESAELTPSAQSSLDVFHLKCLRKVLKMTTTFTTLTKKYTEKPMNN